MINTILTPTDGSQHAGEALDLAADLAAKYGAKLVVMHVIQHEIIPDELRRMLEVENVAQPSPADLSVPLAAVPRGGERSSEDQQIHAFIGNKLLESAADRAGAKGINDVVQVMAEGDPAQRILETADQHEVDLIAMGSRGLGGLKGLLVGSVSQKVNHMAKCNCLFVR